VWLVKLKNQGKFAVGIAVVQIPVMMFAGIIAGSYMGFSSVQALSLGAVLSGASTAVVLAVLKSNNVLDRDKMDVLVLVMVIEDITQVILISILTPMMKGENMSTDSLIVLILSIAFFMIVCFTIGLKIIPRLIDWVYDRSNNELISLLCIGMLFVFALLANTVGLSVAIGAFIAGVIVGMTRPKHVVEEFVDPLKSLFMAMFFISVGMEVSVDSLIDNIPMIATLYILFAVCMFVAVNIGYWVASGDPRTGWISAISMCTMGEFAFIISKLALENNVFDQSFYSSVIGTAILSMILLPFLVRFSPRTYEFVHAKLPSPLRRLFIRATRQRDFLMHGLTVTSQRTKERFNKGLTNTAFLITLISLIEIIFFYIYDPISVWLAHNIGSDEHTWRIVILFFNILILLEPCVRLARFMRLTIYIIDRGKGRQPGTDAPMKYEYFSSLIVGAIITVVIVIIIPNKLGVTIHLILGAVILLLALSYGYRAKSAKKNAEMATAAATDERKE